MYAYNRTHITACIALMTAICGHAVGGDINPPAGAIAPTMKSLDRIEPRVCINDLPGSSEAMHVISEPGNYYLAADIVGEPGKSGIMIVLDEDSDNDNISISMDGFDMIGVPGSNHGIFVPDVQNVRVERFNVKQEFGQQSGTRRWGGDGVHTEGADEVSIEIHSEGNGGAGIRAKKVAKFKAGKALADQVKIFDNGGGGGGQGLPVGGIVLEGCPDTAIIGVDASRNFGTGISVSFSVPEQWVKKVSLQEVRANNNMGDGVVINHMVPDDMSISIRRASMDANAGDGLRIMGVGDESMDMDMSIDEMYVGHNGGYGANIHALAAPAMRVSITDSTFASNVLAGLRCFGEEGARVREVRATRCSSSENGGSGFEILAEGGTFDRCIATGNTLHGFDTDGAPDTMGVSTRKGYDYYQSRADRNVANGVDADGCVVTLNVCHLISNGGHGGDISGGDIIMYDSSVLDNGGSGLRTNNSPIYTENSTCGENALYGVHSTGNNSSNTTTIKGSVVRANGSGGIHKEGGHYCGDTNHLISNGGGGGTGSGLGLIQVASVMVQGSSSTGNTGAGVLVDNSASGISPATCRFDRVNSSGNGGNGLSLTDASFAQLARCLTNNNGGSGIFAPSSSSSLHIESCVASGNTSTGIDLTTGLGHILVNNAAAGNPLGGYRVAAPGNTVGPQVDEGGVIQNGNPGGNYVR